MDLVLKLRQEVLENSLVFESHLSNILRSLLKMNEDAKVLGDTSAALGFMTKINFLRDLGRIDSLTFKELSLFAEIRNKVIHNIKIDSLCKAVLKLENHKLNYLLSLDEEMKTYYQDEKASDEKKELSLRILFHTLCGRINRALDKIYDSIIDELEKAINEKVKSLAINRLNTMLEGVNIAITATNIYIEEHTLLSLPDNLTVKDYFVKELINKVGAMYPDFNLEKFFNNKEE